MFYVKQAMIFTVRLHVMQRTVLLSQFCLSVRLSVCLSDACIVTKLQQQLVGDAIFPLKYALKVTNPLRKTPTSTDFRS